MIVVLRYALPLLGLAAIPVVFFRAPRVCSLGKWALVAVLSVAVLPLAASGAVHLLQPAAFLPLLAPSVPQRTLVILVSGVAELAGAAGLVLPKTRRMASLCLVLLMIAIFPANIYVAGRTVAGMPMPSLPVRWAMQAGYILLLLIAGYGLPALRRRPGASQV